MEKKNDDLFGGLFDFDGDGKTDVFEQGLAYMMFEDITKEDNEENDEFDDDGLDDGGPDDDEFDDEEDDYYSDPAPYRPSAYRSTPLDAAVSTVSNTVDRSKSAKQVPDDAPADLTSKYKYQKTHLIADVVVLLLVAFIWLCVSFMIGLGACTGDDGNYSGTVSAMVVGVLTYIAFYAFTFHSTFKSDLANYRSARKDWLESLAGSKRKTHNLKRAAAIAFIVVLILGILAAIIVPKAMKSSRDASVLSEARALVINEDYSAARKLLYGYFPYDHEEAKALISLCDAHYYYETGSVSSAYYALYRTKLDLLGPELKKEASDFLEVLKIENEAYEKAQEEKEARERREYENKVRTGVPFVGLPESRIGDTSLGKPDPNMRRTTGTYGGKDVIFFRYDFVRDNKIIFSAFCYNGRVVLVEDYRSSPIPTKKPSSYSSGSSSYSYPDPGEFDDPSDFYYWYYDEFVDYEEAEEYYYSHGGR